MKTLAARTGRQVRRVLWAKAICQGPPYLCRCLRERLHRHPLETHANILSNGCLGGRCRASCNHLWLLIDIMGAHEAGHGKLTRPSSPVAAEADNAGAHACLCRWAAPAPQIDFLRCPCFTTPSVKMHIYDPWMRCESSHCLLWILLPH
jgi:hypothetical protein